MLAFLRGKVVDASPEHCVLDVGGTGYALSISDSTYRSLPAQAETTEVCLHVHWVWREQSGPTLYGFSSRAEKQLFGLLLDLNGVGPKTALAIVGHVPLEQLIQAVRSANATLLTRVPGIGKKTAERLVVELQGRIENLRIETNSTQPELPLVGDAIRALMHLGYSPAAADRAVRSAAAQEGQDLSQLITSALQRV